MGILVASLYFDGNLDPEELEKLKNINLLALLQDEVGQESFDMGKVKLIFRALRIAKPYDAVEFLSNNLTEMVVFA